MRHFYVEAPHREAVLELLPSTAPNYIHSALPYNGRFSEQKAYKLMFGQWTIFVSQDAQGQDYLALGLCKSYDATQKQVTVYTIPNCGQELFLVFGEYAHTYLNDRHQDFCPSADGRFWLNDIDVGRTLCFEHGLQVVTLSINATAVPSIEPPRELVKLFASALGAPQPALLQAAIQDLERFRSSNYLPGMRCKVILGYFAGTVATVYRAEHSGPVAIKIHWQGDVLHVTVPASSLQAAFEQGDLVLASPPRQPTRLCWMVGPCKRETYNVIDVHTVQSCLTHLSSIPLLTSSWQGRRLQVPRAGVLDSPQPPLFHEPPRWCL